jgi:hypothetical protein
VEAEMLIAKLFESTAAMWWMIGGTVVMFLGTLALLPWIVCRMPEDYFVRPELPMEDWSWKTIAVRLARNFVGVILILAGIAMLVLPGQGVLTILVGLACLSFRGKRKLMRWFVYHKGVLHGLNWIRQRRNLPPFCNDTGDMGLPHCPMPKTSQVPASR